MVFLRVLIYPVSHVKIKPIPNCALPFLDFKFPFFIFLLTGIYWYTLYRINLVEVGSFAENRHHDRL